MVKAAKRRKKEEDEAFEVPEFDEVAYMEKEVTAAKASFTMITLAIFLAAWLFVLTVVGAAIPAFLIALAVTYFLPKIVEWLPWPKIDVSKFERRDWLGHRGTFFFSWLAFWILFLNVPFVDVTNPVVAGVTVYAGVNTIGVREGVGVPNTVQHLGGYPAAYVNVTAWDNRAIDSVSISIGGTDQTLQPNVTETTYSFRFTTLIEGQQYDFVIYATDASGRRSTDFAFKLQLIP